MRSRQIRAQRKAKEQMRGDFPDFEEEGEDLSEEESFPLIEGTSVNPRQPWQLPQQKEAK